LLTPVLSFAVFVLLAGIIESFGGEGETLTAWNVSIFALCIIGLSLYTYGYARREATDVEAKVILLFSFLLIPWALLTYLFASGLFSATVVRIMNPGMSALTVWDYLEYWTWELKAISWISSGLLLIVTSLVKMHAR
jgi:cbb3-type cytochrome oxidase subunit 3